MLISVVPQVQCLHNSMVRVMQCDKINTEDMPQGSTIIKELPGREVDYGLA